MSEIDYKKLDYKQIPPKTIEKALYGKGGLFDKLVKKIKDPDNVHSVRECANKLGISTQRLNLFAYDKDTNKRKATTIIDYAVKLGL